MIKDALYKDLKKRLDEHKIIKSKKPEYNKIVFDVELPEGAEVSDHELMLYCDEGNAYFGGAVERQGSKYKVTVYTD